MLSIGVFNLETVCTGGPVFTMSTTHGFRGYIQFLDLALQRYLLFLSAGCRQHKRTGSTLKEGLWFSVINLTTEKPPERHHYDSIKHHDHRVLKNKCSPKPQRYTTTAVNLTQDFCYLKMRCFASGMYSIF